MWIEILSLYPYSKNTFLYILSEIVVVVPWNNGDGRKNSITS